MYIYEKQGTRIKIKRLAVNLEEIKKLKEEEIYSEINYLTMLHAEMPSDNKEVPELLLEQLDPEILGNKVGVNLPSCYQWKHRLEIDEQLSEDEAFKYLNKFIQDAQLTTVRYLSCKNIYPYFFSLHPQMYYLALTDPRYVSGGIKNFKRIKVMKGIIPISETLYYANELVKLVDEGDLLKLYTSMPADFIAKNPTLLSVKDTMLPSIRKADIDLLYKYGIPSGTAEAVEQKLEISNEIMKRVRRK